MFRIILAATLIFVLIMFVLFPLAGLQYSGFLTAVILIFAFSVYFWATAYALCGYFRDASMLFIACSLTALALFLRFFCLDIVTPDYSAFLSKWAAYFRENGGIFALNASLGDYNVPYLYFLAVISYIPVYDLYLIKLFSIFFDMVLAVYALKIISLICPDGRKSVFVYAAALFLPTVWLNSAYWAQCDSIYTAFILMALYYVMQDRPWLSVALSAVAFSFKLQTIFFLPLYIALLLKRHISLRHLAVFPAVFFAFAVPALIFGRPLPDIVAIYFNQAGAYSDYLNLNSPSVFALIYSFEGVDALSWTGILISAAFILVVLALWLNYRKKTGIREIFLLSLTFSIGVPYFLPSMHERYFYLASILAIIYGFGYRRLIVPLLAFVALYAGYHAYLFESFIIDLRYASILLFAALAICLLDLYRITFNDAEKNPFIEHSNPFEHWKST